MSWALQIVGTALIKMIQNLQIIKEEGKVEGMLVCCYSIVH